MLYELAIIGGGPAGVAAGIYAARKKIKAVLLTKDFIGQIGKTSEVDNYPGFAGISGLALAERFKQHLKKFAIEIKEGSEVVLLAKKERQFLIKLETGEELKAKAVLVASGAKPRSLGVPGEKELTGRGVSYCPICDAPFFKDKRVAVVGGGNAGFEAALDLARYAQHILLFEEKERVRADELLQELAAKEKKIEVYLGVKVKKIEGATKVTAIIYEDLKTKKIFQLPIEGIFVQIGSSPSVSFLKGLVDFNQRGEIKINSRGETSCPGIFAAGDVTDGQWKQVVIAAGEGAKAALAAYEYLQKEKSNLKNTSKKTKIKNKK